jgi:3-oxoacyl-[acyl-carrier protein] reductase
VVAIAPGYIATEMVSGIKPAILDKLIATVPLKRLGRMPEISHAVQFVIENDFVNGRVLEIDGGLRV